MTLQKKIVKQMDNKIILTVVVDNHSSSKECPGEHGLSLHLQSQNQCMLLDAGKSDLVLGNLKNLKLAKNAPEWIAFSHGHYDHTNGTLALLQEFPNVKLHFHPALTRPKWILDAPETWRYGGVPCGFPQKMNEIYKTPQELIPGIYASGSLLNDEVPKQKNTAFRFYYKEGDTLKEDFFIDEQVLIVQSRKGVSIVSGCAHTGIAKAIQKTAEMFPNPNFYALIGGFHLSAASACEITENIELILKNKFKKVMPLHCSGEAFSKELAQKHPSIFVHGEIGTQIEI